MTPLSSIDRMVLNEAYAGWTEDQPASELKRRIWRVIDRFIQSDEIPKGHISRGKVAEIATRILKSTSAEFRYFTENSPLEEEPEIVQAGLIAKEQEILSFYEEQLKEEDSYTAEERVKERFLFISGSLAKPISQGRLDPIKAQSKVPPLRPSRKLPSEIHHDGKIYPLIFRSNLVEETRARLGIIKNSWLHHGLCSLQLNNKLDKNTNIFLCKKEAEKTVRHYLPIGKPFRLDDSRMSPFESRFIMTTPGPVSTLPTRSWNELINQVVQKILYEGRTPFSDRTYHAAAFELISSATASTDCTGRRTLTFNDYISCSEEAEGPLSRSATYYRDEKPLRFYACDLFNRAHECNDVFAIRETALSGISRRQILRGNAPADIKAAGDFLLRHYNGTTDLYQFLAKATRRELLRLIPRYPEYIRPEDFFEIAVNQSLDGLNYGEGPTIDDMPLWQLSTRRIILQTATSLALYRQLKSARYGFEDKRGERRFLSFGPGMTITAETCQDADGFPDCSPHLLSHPDNRSASLDIFLAKEELGKVPYHQRDLLEELLEYPIVADYRRENDRSPLCHNYTNLRDKEKILLTSIKQKLNNVASNLLRMTSFDTHHLLEGLKNQPQLNATTLNSFYNRRRRPKPQKETIDSIQNEMKKTYFEGEVDKALLERGYKPFVDEVPLVPHLELKRITHAEATAKSCFYVSILHALLGVPTNATSHTPLGNESSQEKLIQGLRESIAAYMDHQESHFRPFFQTDDEFKLRLAEIRNAGWGSEVEIEALSQLVGRPVELHMNKGSKPTHIFGSHFTGEPIRLHNEGPHFSWLAPATYYEQLTLRGYFHPDSRSGIA